MLACISHRLQKKEKMFIAESTKESSEMSTLMQSGVIRNRGAAGFRCVCVQKGLLCAFVAG